MDFSLLLSRFQHRLPAWVWRIPLPGKRGLMIAAAAAVLLLVLWWVYLLISFSEEQAKAQLASALKSYFGREVTMNPQAQFSLFPSPKLTVQDVYIANHPKSSQPSMIAIPEMSVMLDSFSGEASLIIHSPKILLESFEDGSSSWEDMTQKDKKSKAVEESEGLALSHVSIIGGSLQYRYPAHQREWNLSEINAEIVMDSLHAGQSQGSAKLGNAPYQFYANLAEKTAEALDFKAGITDGNMEFHAEGEWDAKAERFTGKQRAVFADFGKFLDSFNETLNPSEAQAVAEAAQKADSKALPLQWEGPTVYDATSQKISFEKLEIDGAGTNGQASGEILASLIPDVTLTLEMKKLSLQELEERGVLARLLTQQEAVATMDGTRVGVMGGKIRGLPRGLNMNLTLTAQKARFASLPVKNLQMGAALRNATIQLSQFSGELPGNGQFILKGVVDSSFEGLALKGQLDFGGAEFGKALDIFTEGKLGVPGRLKQYRGRGNLFFTRDILRLSEMIFRVEDLQLLGTVMRKKGVMPALPSANAAGSANTTAPQYIYETALRVDKLNLDEWHDAQHDSQEKSAEEDQQKENGDQEYPKILRLAKDWQQQSRGIEAQIKASFMDLTLNGQNRGKAMLNMAVNGGGIGISRFEVSYNHTFLSGSVAIGFPQKSVPIITADIAADIVDTQEFFDHDFTKDENFWRDVNGAWSRKVFNLGWMHRFNGKVKLEVGDLTHDVYDLRNVKLEANLQDGLGQISQFSADTLEGSMAFRGQLTASKLPAMSGALSFKNFSIEALKPITPIMGDLTGKLSVSGEFSSTGINPQIVVQNAQGAIAVAGAGITVKGFNLENLTRAANSVRTVADIKKLVDYADQGGATYIDSLKGNAVLGSGFIRSPGVLIATKEGGGSMNGQLNLTDWQVNGAITLYLTVLDAASPPSIRLVFAGPLNQTARTLETQSLESFIAKQSAERILETQ